jgi:hypothetical protein
MSLGCVSAVLRTTWPKIVNASDHWLRCRIDSRQRCGYMGWASAMRRSRGAKAAPRARSSVSSTARERHCERVRGVRPVATQLDLRELELLRRPDEPPPRERDDPPLRLDELVLRERDDDPLDLVDDVLRRLEVRPPALLFAACCAALAACSKSFLIAVANLVESLRASERNLPSPLYRPWVPLAVPRPAWLRSSLSAFSASPIDLFSRLSAAGSLKLVRALLRRDDDERDDDERLDFRACGIPVS